MSNLLSMLKRLFLAFATNRAFNAQVKETEMSTEIMDKAPKPALSVKQSEEPFATKMYVDLDNMLGQLNHAVLNETLAKLCDVIHVLTAKFPGPVKVAVYGNLSYWKIDKQQWLWQGNQIDFIDTPVKNNRHGKTITDEIMITHMARQANVRSTTVLVSSDVGFSPILNDIAEYDGVRTELILFGHAHYQLRRAAFVCHSGMDILSQAGVLNIDTAKKVLISCLQASAKDSVPLPTVALWLAEFKSKWRYKGFKNYLSDLMPEEWEIDSANNQIVNLVPTTGNRKSVTIKPEDVYKKLSLPPCAQEHFKVIFEIAAKHKTRNIDVIKDAIVEALHEQNLTIVPDQAIVAVLHKIIPHLVSKKRPRQLADAYLRVLLQKARLMNTHLGSNERLYLSRLLLS